MWYNYFTCRRALLLTVLAGTCCVSPPPAGAQYRTPSTYADYYQQELQQRTAPIINPNRYTYDRVFYHNPAVSPYTNLLRYQGPISAPNYYQYVLPEQQRRQQVEMRMDEPLRTGGRTPPITQGGLPGVYQNHWYGSRQAMGLR
jgi:hypothetical protein